MLLTNARNITQISLFMVPNGDASGATGPLVWKKNGLMTAEFISLPMTRIILIAVPLTGGKSKTNLTPFLPLYLGPKKAEKREEKSDYLRN